MFGKTALSILGVMSSYDCQRKKTDALVQGHPDSWDERFLRELVGRLKRKGKDAAPWRDHEERCRKYHEHDRWAPMCEGVEVLKEE